MATMKQIANNRTEATRAGTSLLPGKAGPETEVIRAEDADAVERLEAIMDGLAESVLELSDEAVYEEVSKQGRDPVAEAEATRKVLIDALKDEARKAERSPQPFTQ
jgi:hypothetical protein